MSDARLAIAAAKDAGAEQIAADDLRNAEILLSSAEDYLESGSYIAARRDAISAKESAVDALLAARHAMDQDRAGTGGP